jgi:hypothetical protein
MFVDCVLASSRISQVDPGDEPLFEVVLSHELLGNLNTMNSSLDVGVAGIQTQDSRHSQPTSS